MNTGTTKASGWGVFWFLLGFTVLGLSPIGGGSLALIGGSVLIVISAFVFKAAREQEGT